MNATFPCLCFFDLAACATSHRLSRFVWKRWLRSRLRSCTFFTTSRFLFYQFQFDVSTCYKTSSKSNAPIFNTRETCVDARSSLPLGPVVSRLMSTSSSMVTVFPSGGGSTSCEGTNPVSRSADMLKKERTRRRIWQPKLHVFGLK